MLNNMVASFTASNQVGESMKRANSNKKDNKGKKDIFGGSMEEENRNDE